MKARTMDDAMRNAYPPPDSYSGSDARPYEAADRQDIASPPLSADPAQSAVLADAEDLLSVMACRSPGAVADLAHFLFERARHQKLGSVAKAAAEIEQAAQKPGTKSLAPPMRHLSAAIADARASLDR
jgi:hypothetical protein